MRNFIRQAKNEDGGSSVEFAFILPILLMLVFGITEFGRVYSQNQVYQSAAREGGRYAAVRNSAGLGPTTAEVRARVMTAAEPYNGNITSTSIAVSKQCSSTTVGDIVTVSWEQPVTIDIPLIPTVDIDLNIKSAFRCE